MFSKLTPLHQLQTVNIYMQRMGSNNKQYIVYAAVFNNNMEVVYCCYSFPEIQI